MIKIKITKAPNNIYLGERQFFFDEITIGKDAKIPIKSLDLNIPTIHLKIEDNFLLISTKVEFKILHNQIEKSLPLKANIGDILRYKNLDIQILAFKPQPVQVTIQSAIEKEIKKNKDDKQFLKLIKMLSN